MSEARRPRRTFRRIGAVVAGLLVIVVILYLGLYIVADRALNRTDDDAKQRTVTSKDGTLIAFEQTGTGPVVLVVTGALCRPEDLLCAQKLTSHPHPTTQSYRCIPNE